MRTKANRARRRAAQLPRLPDLTPPTPPQPRYRRHEVRYPDGMVLEGWTEESPSDEEVARYFDELRAYDAAKKERYKAQQVSKEERERFESFWGTDFFDEDVKAMFKRMAKQQRHAATVERRRHKRRARGTNG